MELFQESRVMASREDVSVLIRVKFEETGPSKILTHTVDLKELFPDIDIEIL